MTPTGPCIGIVGGGQLGRMLALAGLPLGVGAVVLEPTVDPPADAVAEVLPWRYDDPGALAALASRAAVVTVELEGVPLDSLAWLAARVPVRPNAEAVGAAQDRLAEKRRFAALDIPTAPFAPWPTAGDELPDGGLIVKTRRGGFDGRGQRRVTSAGEVAAAAAELGGEDLIVEGRVEFSRELAIVAARAVDGAVTPWPLVETVHADGILRTARPRLDDPRQGEAEAIVRKLAADLDYVGVLAVELFDTADGLVANEWAPRVHNSGHWTIEGAVTSQFEQHLRAILGWPLGPTAAVGASATVNLIGGVPDPAAVLAVPGAHLHLYGKEPRPARKLGHVTVTAPDDATLDDRLARLDLVLSAQP